MSVGEIIGVVLVVLSVIVLVCVLIHYMREDSNTIHGEMIIRSYARHNDGKSLLNYYLACGWKVKYQSQPLISADGHEYIEYVFYKDEPIKKGDNHDSKQDSL